MTPINFFISYTATDRAWAQWIAWELGRAGYSYRLQAEHFPPGARFVNEMRTALSDSEHILAVLSPAYFESQFASLEMHSGVADDPLGHKRRVIPVRVKACTMPALFRDLVYIDFVGKPEEEQRRRLTAGIRAARLGDHTEGRAVKQRPTWPGAQPEALVPKSTNSAAKNQGPAQLRVQFLACNVGRGLDLEGQYRKIKSALQKSRYGKRVELRGEFDVTDANLFEKLNSFKPNVVHISGNQNGGDVLLPSQDGGEVVVPDAALAGLLSSLGDQLRVAVIDTCQSYRCAKRVAEAVEYSIGVEVDIYDDEAIRFYEVFYQAIGAGCSLADAHGQATGALRFMKVPSKRIPKICVKAGHDAKQGFLLEP